MEETMTTYTSPDNLAKPDHLSTSGWDTLLNGNMDIIQARLSALAAAGGTTVATDVIWDALGDLVYGSGANTGAKLVGNITTTKKWLSQTGTGAVSAIPVWD